MASGDEHDGSAGADENVVRVDFGRPRPDVLEDPERLGGASGSQAKLEAFSDMIERGMVMVTVDARRPDVFVPARFKDDPQLNLNFSQRFYIDDFVWDEEGVRASLTFAGEAHFCRLPWDAVWMLRSHVDGEIMVAPEDIPDEVRSLMERARQLQELAERTASLEARLEEAGSDEDPNDAEPAPAADAAAEERGEAAAPGAGGEGSSSDDDEPPPGRGGLRLIKS